MTDLCVCVYRSNTFFEDLKKIGIKNLPMEKTPGDLSILKYFNTCKTCALVTLKLESREISWGLLLNEGNSSMFSLVNVSSYF